MGVRGQDTCLGHRCELKKVNRDEEVNTFFEHFSQTSPLRSSASSSSSKSTNQKVMSPILD